MLGIKTSLKYQYFFGFAVILQVFDTALKIELLSLLPIMYFNECGKKL